MKKEINVCPYCGEPMISTFAFRGAEFYCLMCGNTLGMFSCSSVEWDEQLNEKRKLYERVFKTIYKDLIPSGAYLLKCPKCKDMNETHRQHASEKEILKDEIAREFLNRMSEIVKWEDSDYD